MDSGRIEDLLQQNITQMQNLQGELRTKHEQQDQKETYQHDAGITDSPVPTELPPFWLRDEQFGSLKLKHISLWPASVASRPSSAT
jgi:hypothetical protein